MPQKTSQILNPSAPDAMELARYELARRQVMEPARYWTPCGKLEDYLQLVNKVTLKDNKPQIFVLTAGNGVGKTTLVVNLSNYISDHFPNPYLDAIPQLRQLPRPTVGRVYTTKNAAETAYQAELERWKIAGRSVATKGGRTYNSVFNYPKTGAHWDLFSVDRDVLQAESTSIHWSIIDEPIPARLFSSITSRMRFGGPIFIVLTPLEGSEWIAEALERPERVGKDVFTLKVKTEDACIDHGVRGHLPHAYYENLTINTFDEAELKARTEGEHYSKAGRILANWDNNYHVWQEFTGYHLECWQEGLYTLYCVTDPHDRKAFAFGWYAVFPNGDVVIVAEYPSGWNFYRDHAWSWEVEEYVKMVRATESEIDHPVYKRLEDPRFGHSPKKGSTSVQTDFANLGMPFDDPPISIPEERHIQLKKFIGRPNPSPGLSVIRPKLYAMAHCENHIYSLSHMAWKLKKGEGYLEEPSLINEDHATCVGYLLMDGARYVEPHPDKLNLARGHRRK